MGSDVQGIGASEPIPKSKILYVQKSYTEFISGTPIQPWGLLLSKVIQLLCSFNHSLVTSCSFYRLFQEFHYPDAENLQ